MRRIPQSVVMIRIGELKNRIPDGCSRAETAVRGKSCESCHGEEQKTTDEKQQIPAFCSAGDCSGNGVPYLRMNCFHSAFRPCD
jgi:hypothetical protein